MDYRRIASSYGLLRRERHGGIGTNTAIARSRARSTTTASGRRHIDGFSRLFLSLSLYMAINRGGRN
jgi:hypothetical protein